MVIAFNSFYGIIYYLEIPFFEYYKITSGPWPWKNENPVKVKKWWDLYYGTIQRVAFNTCVLLPVFQFLALVKDNWKIPYMMEVDELPD